MEVDFISKKLNDIEYELNSLKSLVYGKSKKPVSLKGMLKGTKIREKDIKKSKSSLFNFS